ncbi:MAG: hypothetical protein KDA42_14985 [Planctomycetales bacterium]|nr:hypothetical protein [Planctomycetales bacterium]
MATQTSAPQILESEFLVLRAKLLEAAALLDRLDRAEGSVTEDPRYVRIREAVAVLQSGSPDRAEQLQMIFSLPYDETWREKFFP